MGTRSRKPAAKRRYDSARRKALAGQTREQILASARRLFVQQGFAQTTIDEVAAGAGVASATVYAAFKSKGTLLLRLLDEMEQDADVAALRALIETHRGDATAQLVAFVEFSVRFFTRGADVVRIARRAGQADPDATALWQLGASRRLATCQEVVRGWGDRGALREGLNEARAAEMLWVLCGPEVYGLFVDDRSWSPDAFATWLHDAARHALLQPTEPRRAG